MPKSKGRLSEWPFRSRATSRLNWGLTWAWTSRWVRQRRLRGGAATWCNIRLPWAWPRRWLWQRWLWGRPWITLNIRNCNRAVVHTTYVTSQSASKVMYSPPGAPPPGAPPPPGGIVPGPVLPPPPGAPGGVPMLKMTLRTGFCGCLKPLLRGVVTSLLAILGLAVVKGVAQNACAEAMLAK